jgi:hypothetical protein
MDVVPSMVLSVYDRKIAGPEVGDPVIAASRTVRMVCVHRKEFL